jgi:hypothetical protein
LAINKELLTKPLDTYLDAEYNKINSIVHKITKTAWNTFVSGKIKGNKIGH